VPASDDLTKRARWLAGGIACRAEEHAWSRERWTKFSNTFVWVAAISGAGAGFVTASAFADNQTLAVVGAALTFVSAVLVTLQGFFKPAVRVERHEEAHTKLSLLLGRIRNFIELDATNVSADESRSKFETICLEREDLLQTIIGTEEKAHDAIEKRRKKEDEAAKAAGVKSQAEVASP